MPLLDTDNPWARDCLYQCDGCLRRVRVLMRAKGRRRLPRGWTDGEGGRTLCGDCGPLTVNPPTARETELSAALAEITLAHATGLRQRDDARDALRALVDTLHVVPDADPEGCTTVHGQADAAAALDAARKVLGDG